MVPEGYLMALPKKYLNQKIHLGGKLKAEIVAEDLVPPELYQSIQALRG